MQRGILGGVLALVALAGAVRGQVVINEVLENPPGSGSVDAIWEFIELYGRPGMSLNGYAVVIVKGGKDFNGNDRPDGTGVDDVPEIDEAFSLDGCTIGPNGFFTLVNATGTNSAVGDEYLTPRPGHIPFIPDAMNNRWWTDGLSFPAAHIPSSDSAGNINNDGSTTYILIRRRPRHSVGIQGQSVYSSGYVWKKDIDTDVDYDSLIDFGVETPVIADNGNSLPLAVVCEAYQAVDEVAWSNQGGKEYSRNEDITEIADTPGFNPDAVSRLRYFGQVFTTPIGHRSRTMRDEGGAIVGFEIIGTRPADESWVYGEMLSDDVFDPPPGVPLFPQALTYYSGVDEEGWTQVKGPTDLAAPAFNGLCDPEPDDVLPANQDPCPPSIGGQYHFADLNLEGFGLTPNGFNDHPTINDPRLRQFRFEFAGQPPIAGGVTTQIIKQADFNFDGVVNTIDLGLVQSRQGATLDDTESAFTDNRTPGDPSDDVTYQRYKWENMEFQQILMMLEMDMDDGPSGTNAAFITASDVAAVAALVPPACSGDANADGSSNGADLSVLLSQFGQSVTPGSGADFNSNGIVNGADLSVLLSNFGCGT